MNIGKKKFRIKDDVYFLLVLYLNTILDLLTGSTQRWSDAIDKGHEVRVIALDISRFFVWHKHKSLLTKLMSMGTGGHWYRWIRDFLTGRCIKVVVNGQESSVASINAGVPQRSILGPTLSLLLLMTLLM